MIICHRASIDISSSEIEETNLWFVESDEILYLSTLIGYEKGFFLNDKVFFNNPFSGDEEGLDTVEADRESFEEHSQF